MIYTTKNIDNVASWLISFICAPYIKPSKPALGGNLHLTISLENPESWPNKIFHNSNGFIVDIGFDGTIEIFYILMRSNGISVSKQCRFRKQKANSVADIAIRLNKFIDKCHLVINQQSKAA